MDFIVTALPYVLNLVSGVVLAICTYTINKARTEAAKAKQETEQKEKALTDGVEALLRESIVSAYNKYQDRGYCPIYAKESLKKVYAAYHGLGGNDVATELYRKCLAMPEEHSMGLEHYRYGLMDDGK